MGIKSGLGKVFNAIDIERRFQDAIEIRVVR